MRGRIPSLASHVTRNTHVPHAPFLGPDAAVKRADQSVAQAAWGSLADGVASWLCGVASLYGPGVASLQGTASLVHGRAKRLLATRRLGRPGVDEDGRAGMQASLAND